MLRIPIALVLIILNCFGSLYAMDIWTAVRNGNTKQVEQLIQQDSTLVYAQDGLKGTPLHDASHWGHTETAALLLKHNANLNAQDYFKATPLHYASYDGHTETAALLLKHNANLNAQDYLGETPLHNTWHNTQTTALFLQHRANVNAQDGKKLTPLHKASYNGLIKTIKLLLSYGATPHKPINLFIRFKKYSQIYAQRYESWICKTAPADEVREWEQFKKDNPDVAALARIELP